MYARPVCVYVCSCVGPVVHDGTGDNTTTTTYELVCMCIPCDTLKLTGNIMIDVWAQDYKVSVYMSDRLGDIYTVRNMRAERYWHNGEPLPIFL
jgi:hypothetical protein